MIARAVLRAATVFAIVLAVRAPARAEAVAVHADPTAATTAIELWYRAPAAGYDFRTPGIARLALASVAASKVAGGASVSEIVNQVGGVLSLAVYPDIVMVGASVPSSQAQQVFRAMTNAYFGATVTSSGLKLGAEDSALVAAQLPYDSERTLQDALFAQLFAEGPAHYAPIPDATAFAKFTQSDVQDFAARAFRRDNAIVSLAGNVTGLAAQLHSEAATTAPLDSTPASKATQTTMTSHEAGVGVAWAGPPISDTRAATALDFVADYLFDADHGTVAKSSNVQRDVLLSGQFITLHDPGALIVTISGDAANSILPSVLDAVDKMQQPLDPATFAAARKAFFYHILSQIQTPIERADNNGWYAAEGNAQYAPGDPSGIYLAAANSLDPKFVAETVRRYLRDPVVVHLVRASGESTAT